MSAPIKGGWEPSIHRVRLGRFEVTTFLDGTVMRPDPAARFAANRPAEEIEALLTSHFLPADRYLNSYNVPVVNTGREVIVFDTGNGQSRRGNGVGRLRALMTEHGPTPDEVDIVVITHCHPDHIGGLIEDGHPAFPNARVVFGAHEFGFWNRSEGLPESRAETAEFFAAFARPFADSARFIDPGETVAPGITAVEAYGHSPGHLTFVVESEGCRLLIWADTGNHMVLSFHDPAMLFTRDDIPAMANRTRRRILDLAARERLLISAYHLPFPGLGHVEAQADGFRFVPLSYQLAD